MPSSVFNERVAATLPAPWSMEFLPDGRLLVSERPAPGLNPTAEGHIRVVTQAGGVSAPITGLPANVGVLDIQLDPNFAQNHVVYFSFMERDPAAARIGRAADDTRIDPAGLAVARGVLDVDNPGGPVLTSTSIIWHQLPKVVSFQGSGEPGGRLAFSPDGSYLFISSGDRQEFGAVQSLDNTLGKIIRLYPDGTVPIDNPFAGVPGARPEIWTLGHRNPYGLVFDASGQLWEHEMGPKGGDELNIIRPQANFGWPNVSYGNHYDGSLIDSHGNHYVIDGSLIPKPAAGDGFAASQLWWTPVIAPSGMIFYTSSAFPQWQGDLIISGLQSKGLVIVDPDGATVAEIARLDLGVRTRDVLQGPDGSLWVLYDQPDGRLVQLTPAVANSGGPGNLPASSAHDALAQGDYAFTALSTGKFVAAWAGDLNSGGSGAMAQVYGSDGITVGPEISVHTASTGNQGQPSVSATPGGGFIATYGSRSGNTFTVEAQQYLADGTPSGGPIGVNTGTASFHSPPSVAVLSDARFAVTWLGADVSGITDVRVQLFAANGAKIGGEVVASDHAATGKLGQHVVALAGGGFAVSWTDYGVEAGSNGITSTGVRVQVFNAAGNKIGSPVAVNMATAGDQDLSALAALPDGGFVASWRDDGYAYAGATGTQGIWVQPFDANGNRIASPIHVTDSGDYGFAPAITNVPGIGFAVLWQDTPADASAPHNVMSRLFDFNAQALGPGFVVTADTGARQGFPTAAATDDGTLLIGWTSADVADPHLQEKKTTTLHAAVGSSGNDVFSGTAGRNFYSAGAGGDNIAGGPGADILSGGAGNDRFSGTIADLAGDRITDLAPGEKMLVTDASIASFQHTLSGSILTFAGTQVNLDNLPIGARMLAAAHTGGGVDLTLAQLNDPHDVNGDAHGDVLWRSSAGWFSNWLGRTDGGFAINDAVAYTSVPTDWKVMGSGDFNGDGHADVLWRSKGGQFSDWLGQANGGFVVNDANALRLISTDWKVVGAGDFNGDGRADVLWRGNGGQLSDWLGQANGGFVVNDTIAMRVVPTNWKVAGTGDFNGDGRADVLWRNDGGQVSDWLGQFNGGFVVNDANALNQASTDWKVAGTGDFNGDARDDVLWRNDAGRLSNWLGKADGGFLINDAKALTTVPTNWKVVGTGDINGDGRADILWRSDAGHFSDWLGKADGSFAINDAHALTMVSPDWKVVGAVTSELNTDLLW